MKTSKILALLAVCASLFAIRFVSADDGRNVNAIRLPATPGEQFSPSNARTEDGKLIPVDQFFPASRCLTCHADTHAAWSESLHRNAAREPFYRESADILLRSRGIESTRHCESCHTPVALFSGALTKDAPKQEAPFTSLDHEGVTCTVCHSITEARLDGTGSFTIRRPALLAKGDGSPIFGNFTDQQILADVPGHKRAVMRPLLRQPEFCATCHKVDAPPSLKGYKKVRRSSTYDEWQQSGASHESILPYYRRDARADCRACHMPRIESTNDRAAKTGMIASHRWLGANTVAPLFYGQQTQAALIETFLKKDHLSVDIFAIRNESTGDLLMPLPKPETATPRLGALTSKSVTLNLLPGAEVTVEVVVANRNIAHSFPPQVRDLYECWVEFEAIDRVGKTIYHSGFIKPDGMLDERAHVYRQILLDEVGRPITRHQIWLTETQAYDNSIHAGRSDLVRFRFRAPDANSEQGQITLRARVNYRRVNQDYTTYVLNRREKQMTIPIVRMAEAELQVSPVRPGVPATRSAGLDDATLRWSFGTRHGDPLPFLNPKRQTKSLERELLARRWNDYAIALIEQAQYGPAADAFRTAALLDPRDPNPLVSAVAAEMRTERFGQDEHQLRKTAEMIRAALSIDPERPRTLYYQALVLRAQGKPADAAEILSKLATAHPRDREVQRQLGQTSYAIGRISEAVRAFEAVIAIDPTDANAYQFLSPVYASQGRAADAGRAGSLYFLWREDPLADSIGARFFAAPAEWSEERVLRHVHIDQ
ncbi:MAG TPA: tetratricopeptide repeat protein [Blastocatellia bacterium]|nr:tetratricopeptide repeat protein [Blastocatellia bacterium]